MNAQPPIRRVAVVGFGEAGSILGADLIGAGCDVRAWDIQLAAPDAAPQMRRRVQAAGVTPSDGFASCVADAQLVIVAVTAGSSTDVARQAGRSMHAGQVYMDINSVSPATRRENARLAQASGARYLEAAVMGPVPPSRLAVPMLLGGTAAASLVAPLSALGLNVSAVAAEVGRASAIKMCRSVVIKGLEALTLESMFAARAFGVEDEVLSSLHASHPDMGWLGAFADYEIGRIAEHGARRAAEMREVAATLREAAIDPLMAEATANRQQALVDSMGERGLAWQTGRPFIWRELADALTAR